MGDSQEILNGSGLKSHSVACLESEREGGDKREKRTLCGVLRGHHETEMNCLGNRGTKENVSQPLRR